MTFLLESIANIETNCHPKRALENTQSVHFAQEDSDITAFKGFPKIAQPFNVMAGNCFRKTQVLG